jgi:spoIIIJ-associated protein
MNTTPDTLEQIRGVVSELLGFFGRADLGVEVILTDEGAVEAAIEDSEISPILIGKHGATLSAFQSLVSHIIKTKNPDLDLIFHLDIGGYQKQKQEKLLARVKSLAEGVLDSGQEVAVEDINSLERRLIHKFIASEFSDKLKTESIGMGYDRRLFIKKAD